MTESFENVVLDDETIDKLRRLLFPEQSPSPVRPYLDPDECAHTEWALHERPPEVWVTWWCTGCNTSHKVQADVILNKPRTYLEHLTDKYVSAGPSRVSDDTPLVDLDPEYVKRFGKLV